MAGQYKYMHDTKELNMGLHGFIKDVVWRGTSTCSESTGAAVECSVSHEDLSEELRASWYPFPFRVSLWQLLW